MPTPPPDPMSASRPDPESASRPDPESASRPDPESASRPDPESASRPDPRQGVFETLLVAGGRPVEPEAHLARLAASLRELYDADLDPGAADLVTGAAEGLGIGRVRLTAVPGDGGIALDGQGEAVDPIAAFALTARAVALRSLVVPGGLGPHKWADRTLLERAEARMSAESRTSTGTGATPAGPEATPAGREASGVGREASPAGREASPAGQGASGVGREASGGAAGPLAPLPLLVDEDGSVLEASRANLFAVREGALVTPPLDGRILPGIARAALIEVAREAGYEVHEEPLTAAGLSAADGVFLTGSVRGVQPVASLDGAALKMSDATALLAAALRRRWLKR